VGGGEWDVGPWACTIVFIYDGSDRTGGHKCDVCGPAHRMGLGAVMN
jgi:hypothetical protein